MRAVVRAVPLAAFAAIAAAAFVQSFEALRDVAADVGAVAPHLAWLTPLLIDGTIVAASAVLWSRALDREQHRAALGVVAGAGMVSIGANMLHADPSWIARGIAALPPVALLVSVELAMAELRHRMRHPHRPPVTTPPQDAPAASDPTTRRDTATANGDNGATAALSRTSDDSPAVRARQALAAHVAAGGHPDVAGLASTLARQAGCSLRTAQRAVAASRTADPQQVGP